MCIIAHTAKKVHMPRANVVQCMTSNPAGFFMADIDPAGGRRTIRTLERDKALEFFDSVPADHGFVLHARIPSYGEKTLENVHGWEEDGILFCHNMSLRSLDDMMKEDKWDKTDSEYFFRYVFIPMYRAFGKEAYKDGKLHPYIDRIVRFFAGTTNRFLFIMPDNAVITYGNGWVDDFGGTCRFSNSSYKTYAPIATAPASRPFGGFGLSSLRSEDYDDYDDWYTRTKPVHPCVAPPASTTAGPDGSTLFTVAGEGWLLRTAVHDLVIRNVLDTRAATSTTGIPHGCTTSRLEDAALPELFTQGTADAAAELLGAFAEDDLTDEDRDTAIGLYAEALERQYLRETSKYVRTLYPSDGRSIVESVYEDVGFACELLNIGINFDAKDPERAVTAYATESTKSGGLKPVRLAFSDTVCPLEMEPKEAAFALGRLLKRLHDLEAAPEAKEDDGFVVLPEGKGVAK